MKKKVDCPMDEIKERIMFLLKDPVSEADAAGSPIRINELEEILRKDFEYQPKELAVVLNILSAELLIFVNFTAQSDDGESHDFVLNEICLNPAALDKHP